MSHIECSRHNLVGTHEITAQAALFVVDGVTRLLLIPCLKRKHIASRAT